MGGNTVCTCHWLLDLEWLFPPTFVFSFTEFLQSVCIIFIREKFGVIENKVKFKEGKDLEKYLHWQVNYILICKIYFNM